MKQVTWKCPLNKPPQITMAIMGRWVDVPGRHWLVRNWWSLHQIWHEGTVTIRHAWLAKPQTVRLHPGMVLVFPADTTRDWNVPDQGLWSCVHFCPPEKGSSITTNLPLSLDLGAGAKAFDRQMVECIGCSGHKQARATALLWTLLWEVAGHTAPVTPADRGRNLVAKVQEQIELHLHEQLQVADLARIAGISPAHLRRLFKTAQGISIKRYLQERWLARTRHLLTFSTRPIKAIAADMGMPDLHHFNKTIHRLLGTSPTAIRNKSPVGQ